jgi:hypothetical protein
MNNLSELTFNEKKEIFQLIKYKSDLEYIVSGLKNNKQIFLCYDKKKSLVDSLKFCNKYSLKISGINLKDTIEIISNSSQIPLDTIFRYQLFKQMEKLMECFQDFDKIIPKNDTERFYLMLEGRFLSKKYLQDLLNFGIVSVNGLTSKQQLKLAGTLITEEFYSYITSCWKFENPSMYFDYCQVDNPSIVITS